MKLKSAPTAIYGILCHVALLTLALFAIALRAEAGPPAAVTPQLIASVTAIKPGEKFLVGVHFHIKPPWHIYWRNPGDAGLPTRVELNLPAGFSASGWQWPSPTLFKQPGDLVGYGYEQEVLIFQEVQAPAALEYGTPQHFEANVRWLGCLDICVPGRATLNLDLPIGAGLASPENDIFVKWASHVPGEPMPNTDSFVLKVAEGKIPLEGESADWQLVIEWPSNPSEVYWFPLPDSAFNLSEVKTEKQDRVTRIQFKLKRLKGVSKLPDVLESILSFRRDGLRKAVKMPLKLS